MENHTLGIRLRAKRLDRKLSVAEVASATKINPYYLRAMERDELHLLPPRLYVRGYLKSVAMLLGLDVADLYSLLPSEA